MLPRLIGQGPATVWVDDVQLKLAGTVKELRKRICPEKLAVSNSVLEVTLQTLP